MGEKHVALLRGINVGGKNRIAMADLRGIFAEVGATDIETYIQSGNVVFRAPARSLRGLSERISLTIQERLSLRVHVVLRAASDLARVAASNPFLKSKATPEALHVVFLASAPTAAAGLRLDPKRSPGDQLCLVGKELYLFFPNGLGKSKLTTDYLDRTLETLGTARNWKTVLKLASMSAAV